MAAAAHVQCGDEISMIHTIDASTFVNRWCY